MKLALTDLPLAESHDENRLLGGDCENVTTLDLCRQILAFDSEMPILIGSAWVYPTYCKEGITVGTYNHLNNPREPDDLGHTIKSLIVEVLVKWSGNSMDYQGTQTRVRQPRFCAIRLSHQAEKSAGHLYRGRSFRRVMPIRARSALRDRERRLSTAGRRPSGDGR